MIYQWQKAPIKTCWGPDMVVASLAIDNDHTLDLYCESDQTQKVEAMLTTSAPSTTKEEALKLIELLSALESWSFSTGDALPAYLHEDLCSALEVLEKIVLEKNT
jgi:hypothetical protein